MNVLPKRMRAVIGAELGPPEHYELLETDVPEPGPGEVLVRVRVSGMGYVDGLVSRGLYQVKPTVPYCPGLEYAGTVAAVGERVTDVAIGDTVAVSAFGGGLAEYAVAPSAAVARLPATFDPGVAAGFIVNYTTAWHGLIDRAGLQPGETVLVLGAAGGTGIAAVQVARLAGARVIAGASTETKRAFALAHGAHEGLDYSREDWRSTLKSLTDGRGVDVVYDPVGGDLLEPAFRSLAWRGRHLVIGFAGGRIPALPVNLALLKGSALVGVDYRQFGSVFEREAAARIHLQLFDAVARGDLKPPRGTSFPLDRFRDAMALAASRDGLGKTTVEIPD
ncbi:MAG: NADPH:quinone oxidoreductase family protein [Pseudomonadales bacterium]